VFWPDARRIRYASAKLEQLFCVSGLPHRFLFLMFQLPFDDHGCGNRPTVLQPTGEAEIRLAGDEQEI
jgi:hypothetical protein